MKIIQRMTNKFSKSAVRWEVKKKSDLSWVLAIIIVSIFSGNLNAQEDKPPQSAPDALADWPMIEKEYKALRADRDNILAQVKAAYDERNKALDALRATKENVFASVAEKEALNKKIEILEKEKIDIDEKISNYEIDNKELLDQVESLQKLNAALTQENQEMLDRSNQQEGIKIQAPKSLMGAVKEKEQLIRENADMHYNLGVLMTKNQDYRNAAIEFERATQLRSDDAASYFNLGKIHADFFKDKEKAVGYFQKYLQLSPQAEDRGWVESFIALTKGWRAEEKLK